MLIPWKWYITDPNWGMKKITDPTLFFWGTRKLHCFPKPWVELEDAGLPSFCKLAGKMDPNWFFRCISYEIFGNCPIHCRVSLWEGTLGQKFVAFDSGPHFFLPTGSRRFFFPPFFGLKKTPSFHLGRPFSRPEKWRKIHGSPCQMMSKGCFPSPPYHARYRFHDTILSFGEPGSLGHSGWMLSHLMVPPYQMEPRNPWVFFSWLEDVTFPMETYSFFLGEYSELFSGLGD